MERHGLKQLTATERRELEETAHKTRDVRVYRRAMAILRIDDGEHPEAVADGLGVCQMSVYRWIARYNEERTTDALVDRPRSGRPAILGGISDEEFIKLVEQSPLSLGYSAFAWTVPLLRGHIEREYGLSVSEETIRRRLHRQDYRWKRPRYAYIETDPNKGQKKGGSYASSLWRAMMQQSSSSMRRR